MGDAQSAQREDRKDGAAEEESGKVDDAPTIEDKSLKNKGHLSDINGKADSSVTEVNGLCEEEIAAEAICSPEEDVSETEKIVKEEETPLENEMNEKESPNEADANEDVPLETIEMDAKQNDINESFRRFFSNIGLKLTVKRGSGDIATDMPDETNKDKPNRREDVEDTVKETTSTNAEQNTAQETYDYDSTTCPTLTDVTSEDVLENAEEKTTETKEEVESDLADAATSPAEEDTHQDATPDEQPHSTSPSVHVEEVIVSPIKRFFTTGIFSGLRKKKKPAEDETSNKELEVMEEKEAVEMTEQTVQEEQQDKEEISLGIETEHEENGLKEKILPAAQTTDASTIIATEPEIQSSQEKDKVQASPLKRLLSGSSLKKLSKKQRSRKSSDAKLSDSGEHVSDQLLSSTESAENQKEEGCAQPSAEAAGEEDGAWASFKKLVTPKKRMKRSSLSNEGTQSPGSVEEPKPSEGGQISDHSTEEGKKRKDSSVSWDSVLCGSGRRRSRKTSDSEDESPQIDNDINKQNSGSKHGAESDLERSNEGDEILAHSPKQAGSPSEGDGGSTWKSLKRLVTPKRKAKDEDESKDNVQSDSDVIQDESSFSIKKLLPGRNKRKSAEKQDQVSSDEADKDAASGDEDSDTPAVVPLSEFDTVETEVHVQTQADIESHISKEADSKLQQDLLDQMAESVLPCDSLQTEAKQDQDNVDGLENKESTTPAKNEEPDESDTESISKQQLSDIPEEATPASVTEEAARDDTIAEDLVEITSEAITAPEPLDITLADETEMVSAVSQLSSESSKTSGNTTPVPAEYIVKETDALLHQVVENISISPKAVPVCSDVLGSERIAVSGPNQILEKLVKEETTILEIDRLNATDINIELNVEELGAINELAATTQTDSTSEVNDSVSTEIVSDIPTEEFDTAEIAVDEVHKVDIAHPEESLKEMESIDESHHLVECLSEVNVAVSTDMYPEGDKIVPDEGFLVEAHQTETEPPKIDSQGADSATTVAYETKDESTEQQFLTEKGDQVMHNITDQIEAEDKDKAPVEMQKLQELSAVQAAALDSEEGRIQLVEKDIPEDIAADKTVAYKLKEEIVLLTEVNVEPEKEGELDAAKPKPVQEPEASEPVQASTLDSEGGGVQSPKEEVKSEDSPPVEPVTDEPKETAEHLTEVNVDPENKALPVNAIKIVQEPDVLEAVQAPTLHSEEGSVQSPKQDEKSEDNPPAETVTDEPKEETTPLTGANFEPVNASKEPEVFKAVQVPTLDSVEGSVQSLEKGVISQDVPEGEIVTDESKVETTPLTGANVEPVDASTIDHVQEPEVFEAVQATALDSAQGSVQSVEKEAISEDSEGETVTDEPKEETTSLTEAKVEPVDASKAEHVQEPEALEAVQSPKEEEKFEDNPPAETVADEPKEETTALTGANFESGDASTKSVAVQVPTLESVEGSVQSLEKETISEDVPEAKKVTDEPKDETTSLTEAKLEPVDASKAEHVQEPEVFKAVQASALDSAEGSVQSLEKEVTSEDSEVPEGETVTDESKEETKPLTESKLEPVDASKAEHVQEPESLEAVQASALDSEGSVQSVEKEVKSEDVPEAETVADEPKEKTTSLTEAKVEPVDASKAEHVQEPESLEAVQASALDSEGSVQSLEKEVKSEDVPEAETVADEPKEKTTSLTEAKVEPVDASKAEHVQEPEALEAVQASALESEERSVQSVEKEVKSEDVPEAETVADEPKEETTPPIKVNCEQIHASKPEHAQDPEVLESVQEPILDSEEGSVQSPKEEVQSEDNPPAETVADEPKEETTPPIKVNFEPVDTSKTKHFQEPDILKAVQAATSHSEVGSLLSLQRKVISEDIPAMETVTDEPKQETQVEPQEKLPVEAAKTEHGQEPEVLEAVQPATLASGVHSLLSIEKEVISEDIPAVETVTDEPKQETEVDPEEKVPEEAKMKHKEPEVLPSDVKDIVTETKTDEGTSMYVHAVTESIEGGSAQELAEQILLEDFSKPEVDNVASVREGLESEVVEKLDRSLETVKDQQTESIPQNVRVEQEDYIPEAVEELPTLKAVSVSSVNEEASNVQVFKKTVFTGETPAPCVDIAAVTERPKHELHLSAVQGCVDAEEESELPGTEVKTAAVEHTTVTQVVICNLKDVSAAIPDVLIEKTSSSTEPLIDRVASELVVKEEVETATPLVKDDVSETAKEGSVVMMMHVPSVEFEDNHRIQVQVVADDMKSAETIVDTVLEVGVTEAKEVIDVCHETVRIVDSLSATPRIEEELINEKNKVTIQEVIQHVKENLPETVTESVVVSLEKEVIKQPDAVTEVSEMVESESNDMEDQKVTEDSIATLRERQDEASTVISDVSATEQLMSEDLMQTRDIPESLDVSIHDQKDNLEETEREKSVGGVAVEEVKSSQIILEEAQVIQSPTVTPINTELVAPQNTGIISTGNVDTPSSLSSELKLANASASMPPVLSEACDQETKAKEHVKQKEDDQDVWMDAEEDIDTQEKTKVSLLEVEESLEPQTENDKNEKAGLEHEDEMAPQSKNEEGENQQETYKTAATCETDSEGEDFAVALEHPATETESVTTMERD